MKAGLAVEFETSLKRHINGSVMTMEAMETAFASVLARSSLCQLEPHVPRQDDENIVTPATTTQSELHAWNGSFHRVSRDFELPPGTLRVTWQCWCVGQPALRLLSRHDMASRPAKIRLAELQRLMRVVDGLLTDEEVLRARCSTDAAGLLYEQVKQRFPFNSTSSKGRSRRLDQLSWRTLAREVN